MPAKPPWSSMPGDDWRINTPHTPGANDQLRSCARFFFFLFSGLLALGSPWLVPCQRSGPITLSGMPLGKWPNSDEYRDLLRTGEDPPLLPPGETGTMMGFLALRCRRQPLLPPRIAGSAATRVPVSLSPAGLRCFVTPRTPVESTHRPKKSFLFLCTFLHQK
jgi:hypothetical protein